MVLLRPICPAKAGAFCASFSSSFLHCRWSISCSTDPPYFCSPFLSVQQKVFFFFFGFSPEVLYTLLWHVMQVQKKIPHGLRIYLEEHWSDYDFVAFMKNAFNAVSRQAVVKECATFSP